MAVDTMIFDKLYGFILGDRHQEWRDADEGRRHELLQEEGLDHLTQADMYEAVTLMSEELSADQASLLAPATYAGAMQTGTAANATEQVGPVVNQVVEGDTTVAGGNVGATQVDAGTAASPTTTGPVSSAPAPAPAPGGHAGGYAGPPPPPAYHGEPVEVLSNTLSYYVDNAAYNMDDRDTHIDNATTFDGDVRAKHLDIENDVQTAGDGAVQLGEHAEIYDSALATGDGAVAADGHVEGVITGNVSDSTVIQGDHFRGVATGDVEGVVATDHADVDGVNTGYVGGDMVTNSGPGNVATGGSEVTDVNAHGGGTTVVGDGNITATGGAQAAGGDAIDAYGNVNTGAGDQTDINLGGVSSGGDLNFNVGGDQNVTDVETTNYDNDRITTTVTDNDYTSNYLSDNDTTYQQDNDYVHTSSTDYAQQTEVTHAVDVDHTDIHNSSFADDGAAVSNDYGTSVAQEHSELTVEHDAPGEETDVDH